MSEPQENLKPPVTDSRQDVKKLLCPELDLIKTELQSLRKSIDSQKDAVRELRGKITQLEQGINILNQK